MKRFFLYITVLILMTTNSYGQWKLYFSNYSARDENVFNNYKKTPDTYFVPRVNVSRITQKLEWYYSAQTTQLQDNSQFNNQTHTTGIELFNSVNNNLLVYWGISGKLRINNPDYNYFDYYLGRAYAWGKWYSADNMLTRFGLTAQTKSFPQEESWNHYEFSGMVQHNIFLQTGTTVRLTVDGLVRDFLYYEIYEDDVLYTGELPTLWQSIFSARIAQSISSSIGGYSEFRYRYIPSETNPYDPVIQSFSPIDDYFGYGGYNWLISIKYKFTVNLWVRINSDIYLRDYKNRPIYEYDFATEAFYIDEDGYYVSTGESRKDSGYEISVAVNYQLDRLFNMPSGLAINLEYAFRNNSSNDAYYDFQDSMLSLYLKYNLQF